MLITKLTPAQFKQHILENQTYYNFIKTPAGSITVFATQFGIYKAVFNANNPEVTRYILKDIDLNKLILVGTEFQIKVWQTLLTLPNNITLNHQDIANKIGAPKACRAVANALSCNNIAYFVPCHRVIRKDGKLGGYKWGIKIKEKLLCKNYY